MTITTKVQKALEDSIRNYLKAVEYCDENGYFVQKRGSVASDFYRSPNSIRLRKETSSH